MEYAAYVNIVYIVLVDIIIHACIDAAQLYIKGNNYGNWPIKLAD